MKSYKYRIILALGIIDVLAIVLYLLIHTGVIGVYIRCNFQAETGRCYSIDSLNYWKHPEWRTIIQHPNLD